MEIYDSYDIDNHSMNEFDTDTPSLVRRRNFISTSLVSSVRLIDNLSVIPIGRKTEFVSSISFIFLTEYTRGS